MFKMEINLRHTPSFGVARVTLNQGESINAEAGSMMAMASSLQLTSKAQGGLVSSFKRAALGGESFFTSTFSAVHNDGWVDFAPRLPGDVINLQIDSTKALVLTQGAWIASEMSVTLDTKWGGFKRFLGGEGAFLLHASGVGSIVLGCYGALEIWTLAPGETMIVDSGHLVANDDTCTMELKKASGGVLNSIKSGEGLVFQFTGPGRVFTQTRNPIELALLFPAQRN